MHFAPVHMSHIGTFETCRRKRRMSVYRGRPEVAGTRGQNGAEAGLLGPAAKC
jgi:hypothetical protein